MSAEFWRRDGYVRFGKIRMEKGEETLRVEPGFRVYRDSPTSATFQVRGTRGAKTNLHATSSLGWADVRALRDYLTEMLRGVGEDGEDGAVR